MASTIYAGPDRAALSFTKRVRQAARRNLPSRSCRSPHRAQRASPAAMRARMRVTTTKTGPTVARRLSSLPRAEMLSRSLDSVDSTIATPGAPREFGCVFHHTTRQDVSANAEILRSRKRSPGFRCRAREFHPHNVRCLSSHEVKAFSFSFARLLRATVRPCRVDRKRILSSMWLSWVLGPQDLRPRNPRTPKGRASPSSITGR